MITVLKIFFWCLGFFLTIVIVFSLIGKKGRGRTIAERIVQSSCMTALALVVTIFTGIMPVSAATVEVYRAVEDANMVHIKSNTPLYYTLDRSDPQDSKTSRRYQPGDIIVVEKDEILLIRSYDLLNGWGEMKVVRGEAIEELQVLQVGNPKREIHSSPGHGRKPVSTKIDDKEPFKVEPTPVVAESPENSPAPEAAEDGPLIPEPVVLVTEPVKVDITPKELEMEVGDTYQLTVSLSPGHLKGSEVAWISDKTKIVSVDNRTGLVTALKPGDTFVSVIYNSESIDICTIKVVKKAASETESYWRSYTEPSRSSPASKPEEAKKPDESKQPDTGELPLVPMVQPPDTSEPAEIPEASDIVEEGVDGKGENLPSKTSSSRVRVEEVSLTPDFITIDVGQDYELSYQYSPLNAVAGKPQWSSEDKKIATVKDGAVQGVSPGETVISVTVDGKVSSCTVIVNNIKPNSIYFHDLIDNHVKLEVGEFYRLLPNTQPPNASLEGLIWESRNQDVADIDQNGEIIAISEGITVVEAQIDNLVARCMVTIIPEIRVDFLSLPRELILEKGKQATLNYQIYPEEAMDKKAVWETGDASVATVTREGIVKALEEGETFVRLQVGTKTAVCSVIVRPVPVETVHFINDSVKVGIGQTRQLIFDVSPINAGVHDVEWAVEDSSIAVINRDGYVEGISVGTTEASVTVNGSMTVTCLLEVLPEATRGIDLPDSYITLQQKESVSLRYNIYPEGAQYKRRTFYSSDPRIASIDRDGKITANKVGTVTIQIAIDDLTEVCTVEVTPIPPTEIRIAPQVPVRKNDILPLTYTVYPKDADGYVIDWISLNEDVATVDKNGNVTAISPGTAVIRAIINDTVDSACIVAVLPPLPKRIELKETFVTLAIGETSLLSWSVLPEDSSPNQAYLSSENPEIAAVTQDGAVCGLNTGTAVITLTCGEVTSRCTVVVYGPNEPEDPEESTPPVNSGIEGEEEEDRETDPPAEPEPIKPESLILNTSYLQIREDQTASLQAYVNPDDAVHGRIQFESDNPGVVQVYQDGTIVPQMPGTAVVTASVDGLSASCSIEVYPLPQPVIVLDDYEYEIYIGDQIQIGYQAQTYGRELTFVSYNSSVAVVSDNGTVTGLEPGTAYITLSAGNESATCLVRVLQRPVYAEQIAIVDPPTQMMVGETRYLTASILPGNVTNQQVIWSSELAGIASVDTFGLLVAHQSGSTVIGAEIDGKITSFTLVVTQ